MNAEPQTLVEALDRLHEAVAQAKYAMMQVVLCAARGHDWDYFIMTSARTGLPEGYRCCMRCERTERIGL